MAQFLIKNNVLRTMDECQLTTVLGENENELWLKEKENTTGEMELIGVFETKEAAAYIAHEIQAEAGIKSGVPIDFLHAKHNKHYIFKNDTQKPMICGTYFIAFDQSPSNVHYRNFQTKQSAEEFIQQQGILPLYNDWLDWIVSDRVATKVGTYYIGKVIEETKNMYRVAYEETQEEVRSVPTYSVMINALEVNVTLHLQKYDMDILWQSKQHPYLFVITGNKTIEEVRNIPYVESAETDR